MKLLRKKSWLRNKVLHQPFLVIFLLDQKIDVEEYMKRIATITEVFSKFTSKEELEVKNWIRNTLQEEVARQTIEILNTNKKEVNSSKV